MTRRPLGKYYPGCFNGFKHLGQTPVIVCGAICGKQATHLVEFKKTLKQTKRGGKKSSIASVDYIHQILKQTLVQGSRKKIEGS